MASVLALAGPGLQTSPFVASSWKLNLNYLSLNQQNPLRAPAEFRRKGWTGNSFTRFVGYLCAGSDHSIANGRVSNNPASNDGRPEVRNKQFKAVSAGRILDSLASPGGNTCAVSPPSAISFPTWQGKQVDGRVSSRSLRPNTASSLPSRRVPP